MSRFVFLPASIAETACSAPAESIPPGQNMESGGEYEVSAAWAERLCAMIPGIDGAPCLVPVDQPADAPSDPAKPGRKPKA